MEENQKDTYLAMLQDVLQQKDALMEQILQCTKQQETVLRADVFDEDAFDELTTKKASKVEKIEELDDGFERIYSKVRETMKEHQAEYKDQIIALQSLIQKTLEKGVALRCLELQNQKRLAASIQITKDKVREFTINQQVASNYYKSMSKLQTSESHFMDKKR